MIVWIWSEFGWIPRVVMEEKERTGAEKMKSLYDFAVLFGMPPEQAIVASFFELNEFVTEHMGVRQDEE